MATAWMPSSKPRTGLSAGPLRVLWLAALLFGVLYTHGVSAETATSHTTNVAAGPAAYFLPDRHAGPQDAQSTSDHDEGGQHSHPAGKCVSGQPQQGSGPSAPAQTVLEPHSPCPLAMAGKSALPGERSALPPPRSTANWVIQRV
ncbi:hypothetical protein V1460_15460 [Streptomyces sp. SCSIO 30461]|uniref:hypothetical protein n=1 Tax=Streptomyces sp. SCSIO 30461 TaxID=3118085 RepID=UPI0030CDB677